MFAVDGSREYVYEGDDGGTVLVWLSFIFMVVVEVKVIECCRLPGIWYPYLSV
jgi:hypothetical protein